MIFGRNPFSPKTVEPREGRRIALIVEDDPCLQSAMGRELVRIGFDVWSVRHFDAAIRHLATLKPDLACIDVGLPDQSGYDLCEYIRGPLALRNLPILVTSENGSAQDMAYAEDAGGNAFLRKPFSARELTRCVGSLLEWTPWRAGAAHELARLGQRRGLGGSRPCTQPPRWQAQASS